jgi:REP element-mobilizing transposase RayT
MHIQLDDRLADAQYGNIMRAARSKRRHRRAVQQDLFRHGGKRKGAGRPPTRSRAGTAHRKRPTVKPYHALHVTMRVVADVGSMRRREMYRAVRDATVTAALRERFRIVHLSIQRTHIHLLAEADSERSLARGMQGFQISVARNVNTMMGDARGRRRRGPVFADRYHLQVIASPRQARRTLSYVLNNWRHHKEDQNELARTWLVDPWSSGIWFPDWKELEGKAIMWPIRATYDPLVVRRPASWLLREGWKRAGSISVHDVPGKR